ncbi:MAG: hypothetical protein ABJB12_20240 [Pseudomonadota bacterium]
MPASLTRLLDTPLLEPVLLLGASRRAAELPPAARERMKPFVAAARARFRVALELRDPESLGTAFGLLREAAFLALRALEESTPEPAPAPHSPISVWERFCAPPARLNAPESLAEVRQLLATEDVLVTEARLPPDAAALRASAEEVVTWLLSLAEVRSPRELARARALHSAVFVVALLVIIGALLGYWLTLTRLAPHAY